MDLMLVAVVSALSAAALGALGVRLVPGFISRETKPGLYRFDAGSTSRLPLVGGLAVFVALCGGMAVAAALGEHADWTIPAIGAIFLVIGLADDILKARAGKGFDDRASFGLALAGSLAAALLITYAGQKQQDSPFSLTHWTGTGVATVLVAGWAFTLFLGTTVGTGISDGVDGLTAGLVAIATAGMAASAAFLDTGAGPAAALTGAAAGFLLLNLPSAWSPGTRSGHRRAKAYLGDSGALALGAMVAAVAFAAGIDLLLPVVAGVFWIEGLSSLVQAKLMVPLFRRVELFGGPQRRSVHYSEFPLPFVAAPLHHHLELVGLSRLRIVALLWTIGCTLAVLAAWAASGWPAQGSLAAYAVAVPMLAGVWFASSAFRPAFIDVAHEYGHHELRLCHGRPRKILGVPMFTVVDRKPLEGLAATSQQNLRRPMNPRSARTLFASFAAEGKPPPETTLSGPQ